MNETSADHVRFTAERVPGKWTISFGITMHVTVQLLERGYSVEHFDDRDESRWEYSPGLTNWASMTDEERLGRVARWIVLDGLECDDQRAIWEMVQPGLLDKIGAAFGYEVTV